MKNFSDTIGNRTRDLPTAPPRAPSGNLYFVKCVLFVSSDSFSHACETYSKIELDVIQCRNQYGFVVQLSFCRGLINPANKFIVIFKTFGE